MVISIFFFSGFSRGKTQKFGATATRGINKGEGQLTLEGPIA